MHHTPLPKASCQNLFISTSYIVIIFLTMLAAPSLFAEEKSKEEKASPHTSMNLECDSTLSPEEQDNSSILTVIGVRCFEDKEYLMALNYYRQAYNQSKSPFLLGALGRVFEELGHASLAANYYQRFLERAYDMDGRIGKRLKKIEKQLKEEGVKFTLDSKPSGAQAFLILGERHEEPLGKTPLKVELIPGSYRIILRKDQFQNQEMDIEIPGDIYDSQLIVPLYSSSSMRLNTHNDTWDRIAVITYLASTPIVVGGIVTTILGHQKVNDGEKLFGFAKNDAIEKGSTYKTVGYTLLGVGIAGLLTATTFELLSIDFGGVTEKMSASAPKLSAYLAGNGAGIYGVF